MDDTNDKSNGPYAEAGALALSALVWMLGAPERAERLLALTGLTPDGLRAGLLDPAVQGALLTHLAAHEPDLIACSVAIDCAPEALVTAARTLSA